MTKPSFDREERKGNARTIFIIFSISLALTIFVISSIKSDQEEQERKKLALKAEIIDSAVAPRNCYRPSLSTAPAKSDEEVKNPFIGGRVSNFDILGVRLYSPAHEVFKTAKAFTNLMEPSVTLTSCAADWIERDRSWRNAGPGKLGSDLKTSCVDMISFGDNEISARVEFVEDLPNQPGCMLASHINFSQKGKENDASIAAWNKALLAKYGDRHGWGSYFGPQLQASETYYHFLLDLSDHAFAEDRKRAFSKAIADAKPAVQPRF